MLNGYNNRHFDRSSPVPETLSFSLTETGSWTDLFGSCGFDSILKYYRYFRTKIELFL